MSSPAPGDGYTVALLDASEGIWRCSLCGWEVETDDDVRGYCSEGHQIDCTDIPDFEAADKCISDGDSIVSSEGWNDYEEDGWIDEDPYKILAQSMKHIDELNCDATLLGQAFDEIDSIEDGHKVLIQNIVFIDFEDSEDEDSADRDRESESDDAETLIAGGTAAHKVGGEERENLGREIEESTGNEDDVDKEGEEDNENDEDGEEDEEDGEKISGMLEKATSDEDDSASDEEELEDAKEGATSVIMKLLQTREESVTNLKDTIDLLTKLCEGLMGGAASRATHGQTGAEESRAPGVNFAGLNPPNQQTLAESEAVSTISGQQVLLDTADIEVVIKKRRDFKRYNEENPPQNEEEEDRMECDLDDLNADLAAAIEKSRLARNEIKRRFER